MLEKEFSRGLRICLTLLFLAGGLYLGWGKMSPVPAIVLAAGINTLLIQRLSANGSRLKGIRNAFLFYFLAELVCFMGLYLFAHEFFLLLHDALHVISLFCLFAFISSLFPSEALARLCSIRGCAPACDWSSETCVLRKSSAALMAGSVILSFVPLLLWWFDQKQPFLGIPQGITEASRLLNLVVFPVIALSFFILIFLRAEIFRLNMEKRHKRLAVAASAMLAYSLFQLLTFLLAPAAAIPVEEFLEFFPMVPVFYFLADSIPILSGNGRKLASLKS